MSEEIDPFDHIQAHSIIHKILNGDRSDYDILYRVTASEDYEGSVTHVGIIECERFKFAVDFEGEKVASGKFFINPDVGGCFPSITKWMITNNSSIDYGIEVDTDEVEA